VEGGEPGTSLLERRVVPQEVPSWAAVAEQVPVPWLEVPPERSRRPGVDEQGCGFRYENGGGNSARLGAYRENSELEGLFASGSLTEVVRLDGIRGGLTDEELEKFVESFPIERI
jgi:hypothetical protein